MGFAGFDESGNYCSPDHYSDDSSDESENSLEMGLKDKCHSTRASHVALASITEVIEFSLATDSRTGLFINKPLIRTGSEESILRVLGFASGRQDNVLPTGKT